MEYDALKDTTKGSGLLIQGRGFVGEELPGRGGAMRDSLKGTGTPVLAMMSDMKSCMKVPMA